MKGGLGVLRLPGASYLWRFDAKKIQQKDCAPEAVSKGVKRTEGASPSLSGFKV